MYDILAYVFENCRQAELAGDRPRLAKKLSAAGFDDGDISEALQWLAGMDRPAAGDAAPLPDAARAFRAYAPRELAKLDAACRGFLMALEHSAILNPYTRELVLDRALAASGGTLSLEQLKLVVLMVLWNRPAGANRLLAEEFFGETEARRPS